MDNPNKLLYHYTTENGILGIMKKDKIVLELSHANSLNDYTEGLEILELLKKVSFKLLEEKNITEEQKNAIFKLAEDDKLSKLVVSGMDVHGTNCTDYKEVDDYIISFSEKNDYLPLWNYYSSKGQIGYCICFNSTQLNSEICYENEVEFRCEKIVYDDFDKEMIIKDILLRYKDKEKIEDDISADIYRLKFTFKNKAFKYEKEHRLIISVPKKPNNPTYDIKFKTKNGIIIPYISVEILEKDKPVLINGITIGPLANDEIICENLKLYLNTNGYNFIANNICKSKIPIRF